MQPSYEQLPDVVPVVTFPIELSKVAEFVDFDYQAFDKLVRENGATDNEVERHTISFELQKDNILGGEYIHTRFFRTKRTTIMIVPAEYTEVHVGKTTRIERQLGTSIFGREKSMEESLNQILLHETGHFVDSHHGMSTQQNNKAKVVQYGQPVTGLSFLGTFIAGCVENSGPLIITSISSVLALAGLVNYSNRHYGQHADRPWEKAATAFENANNTVKLIKFVPHPDLIHHTAVNELQKTSDAPRD